MNLLWRWIIFVLLHLYVTGKLYTINGLLQNGTGVAKTMEGPLQADSAKRNQTCGQLLKDSKEFLGLVHPSSSWLLKPALALGLLQIKCLTKQDTFWGDLIKDEAANKVFNIMAEQINASFYETTTNSYNRQHDVQKLALLRFNLESLNMNTLPPSRRQHCSGIQQEEHNVVLKGSILGVHSSLQHAKNHCDRLGHVCAGISSDTLDRFKCVARNGGYIIPHNGSKLWLHHCTGKHIRRRSTDPECHSENELRIHNVMQWIPVVSSYYNTGSAIYYATQGCTDYAEDRVIEASIDIGYDTLFAATGGISGAIGTGVGIAAKPALKAGVKSAINYFRGMW
ncbi:apolipoprotein F [Phyllobates terribilis]|uniref:apolipoprotein F n=1 Tax=Phyllobates terribilis TaxID=111132 RepID=UPI003CCB40E4